MGVSHEAAPCGLCKRHGPSKTFAPVFLRSSTPESWCRRTAGTSGPYLRYRKRKARNDRAATIPWRAGEIGLLLDGSRWLLARKEGQPGSSPSSSSSEPSGTSDGRTKGDWRQELNRKGDNKPLSTCWKTLIYAHLGEKEKTPELLNYGFQHHCDGLQFLNVELSTTAFDTIHASRNFITHLRPISSAAANLGSGTSGIPNLVRSESNY